MSEAKNPNVSFTLPTQNFTKKASNIPNSGTEYEYLIALTTFMLLKDGQQLMCQTEKACNFNIVVRDEKNRFYFRQVKSRPKSNSVIGEGQSSSDTFSLSKYLESFLGEISEDQSFKGVISLVEEFTLTTNVNFDPQLVRSYLERADSSPVWGDPLDRQSRRYRFQSEKIDEIKNKIKNITYDSQHIDIDLFLAKLVFEVNYPDVKEQENLVKKHISSLIPLMLNEHQKREAVAKLKNKLQSYTDFAPKEQERWPDVKLRQQFLLEILMELRKLLKISSPFNYESRTLVPFLETIESLKFPPEVQLEFENNVRNNPFDVLNIIVPTENSMPILASCKVLSYFRQFNLLDKVWMIDVKSNEDGECFGNMFKHSNVEIFRNCIFVVEFSKQLDKDSIKAHINKIFEHMKTKQLVKFVFITSEPVNYAEYAEVIHEVVDYLSCECFTDNISQFLSQKVLRIQNGSSVNLIQLGISLTDLNSLSLSELVLADENSQLDLLLPYYDPRVETTYIRRKLRFDLIKLDENVKHQLCFKKLESTRNIILNLPRKTSARSQKNSKERSEKIVLLTKVNNVKMKDFRMCEDKYGVVDEELLIRDNTTIEKGTFVKLAFLVDPPGTGKSTLLTHLSNTIVADLSKDGGSLKKLVLRVNLRNSRVDMNNIPLTNETDAVHFFSACIKSSRNEEPTANGSSSTLTFLSNNILQNVLSGNSAWSVIVMFDGFDEISRREESFVVSKFIRSLGSMKGVDRIIATSRPMVDVQQLHTLYNQFAMHLVEFNSHDQENLLYKIWQKMLRENENQILRSEDEQIIVERCKNFIKTLVSIARRQLKCKERAWRPIKDKDQSRRQSVDEDRTILDVPLQCILLAGCFYDGLIEYIKGNDNLPMIADHTFDVLVLFDTFFKKIIGNYHFKRGLGVLSDKDLNTYIALVGRVFVYHKTNNKRLAEYEEVDGTPYEDKLNDDMSLVKQLGLIAHFIKNENGEINFVPIHHAFDDYLVAKYLVNLFQEQRNTVLECDISSCSSNYELILDILLRRNDNYGGVRRFFNYMIERLLSDSSKDKTTLENNSTRHGRFNDFLAKSVISSRSDIFAMFTNNKDRQLVPEKLAQFMPLFKWFMLCLEEHVSRSLNNVPTNKQIEIVSENIIRFLSEFSKCSHSDVALQRELLSFLLNWHVHSVKAEETRVTLKNYFFRCIEQIDECIHSMRDYRKKVHYLASISRAVTRQQLYTFRETKIHDVCQRIYDTDNQSCEISQLILSYKALTEYYASRSKFREVVAAFYESNNDEKCSFKLNNVFYRDTCFEDLLKIGSPNFWDGNVQLLRKQIDWFLSLTPLKDELRSFFDENYLNSRPNQIRMTRCINPFLVMCVEHLLLMIDIYIAPDNPSDDTRERVVRQALRLDVRILQWLEQMHVLRKRDGKLKDSEEAVLRNAINVLPLAHRVAHDGDFSAIQAPLQGKSLYHELFKWSLSKEDEPNKETAKREPSNLDSTLVKAYSYDPIPPALYLAAANNQIAFCHEVFATFPIDKQTLASFIAQCTKYALDYVGDECVVLPFLDLAKEYPFTKEEFCKMFAHLTERYADKMKQNNFSYGGKYEESLLLFTLMERRWTGFLIKFLEFYVDGIRERTSVILKITSLILRVDGDSFHANSLLHYALKIAGEAGIVHQEFYTPAGHSIVKSLFNHLGKRSNWSESTFNESKSHLRIILSKILEKETERNFVTFVCASEDYVFGEDCAFLIKNVFELDDALRNDIVQEFILPRLTEAGIEVLIGAITDNKHGCWLDLLVSSRSVHNKSQRIEFFKNMADHLLQSKEGAGSFEELLFSVVREDPFNGRTLISYLMPQKSYSLDNQELVDYLQQVHLGENLIKRASILSSYRKEILGAISLDKFVITIFLKKYSKAFAPKTPESCRLASLTKLENFFGGHCAYSLKGEFFGDWMDVAIHVLEFLNNQLILMSTEQDNVLSACWNDITRSEKRKRRLLFALALAGTLFNTITEVADDGEVNEFNESPLEQLGLLEISSRNLAPNHKNFLASLDYLCGTEEFRFEEKYNDHDSTRHWWQENVSSFKQGTYTDAFSDMLTLLNKRDKFSSLFENMHPNKVCHGLVMFLVNVAIVNRWIT